MKILSHEVEFIESIHQYLIDGVCVPSITQLLKETKFKDKYNGVDMEVLRLASERGTRIHKSIEDYETNDIDDDDCIELHNWKFLKKAYNFNCIGNEETIIVFDKNDNPVACGRLDLVLEQDDKIGLGDIKTTYTLDTDYLEYQLNLYRIGYEKCYGKKIDFLKGVHLRKNTRKYVDIPINEDKAYEIIEIFKEGE